MTGGLGVSARSRRCRLCRRCNGQTSPLPLLDSTAMSWVVSANASMPDDPMAVLRSRRYLGLLVTAAILGVPISVAAYFFLWAVNHGHQWLFEALPTALGFETVPP